MLVKHSVFGNMSNNAFLIIDEETNCSALVDCPEASDRMYDLIGDTDLKYILLTHGHFDHIGGVAKIKEKYNPEVVISKEDAPMLSSSKLSLAVFVGEAHNCSKADKLISDGDVIVLGNTKIEVLSTPGHTSGSVCYKAEGYLFTGDTLFYCSCGRTDFPTGNAQQMMTSLNKLKNLDGDYDVCTGHDRLSRLSFERENNPYMKNYDN